MGKLKAQGGLLSLQLVQGLRSSHFLHSPFLPAVIPGQTCLEKLSHFDFLSITDTPQAPVLPYQRVTFMVCISIGMNVYIFQNAFSADAL
jgi:hypothetical protein